MNTKLELETMFLTLDFKDIDTIAHILFKNSAMTQQLFKEFKKVDRA